jgi:hypothetical protein
MTTSPNPVSPDDDSPDDPSGSGGDPSSDKPGAEIGISDDDGSSFEPEEDSEAPA